ncbi:MAG: YdiU family protein [Flavobacteriaceae bacterium]|nr:YdiU family protein [Flavobacteriaceae bacterium]
MMPEIKINPTFIQEFPTDISYNNLPRATPNRMATLVYPVHFSRAELIIINYELAAEFGIEIPLNSRVEAFLNAQVSEQLATYATAYSGHQFGNWAGQLGDGRAIFAGEICDENQKLWEIQWKGAGSTPYSRRGDGRAVLRSTIREYLMSEAMYHLGVPTSRALSMSLTGENVMRDMLYDGNPKAEKGALMVRTAESFLRFGHFEFAALSSDRSLLKKLTDWTIKRYFTEITSIDKNKYLDFFEKVRDYTIEMIIEWYRVGFVHGVMNTDNMSILGLSIDYGPYAMMEDYDLDFTSNTTDLPGKRYAFGKQASIAHWNLTALANALFPLVNEVVAFQKILDEFEEIFWNKFDQMMMHKLGFEDFIPEKDIDFLKEWQILMMDIRPDFTLFFVELMHWVEDKNNFNPNNFLYQPLTPQQQVKLNHFLENYEKKRNLEQAHKRFNLEIMQKSNPKFILRNYLLFQATQEAEQGNFDLFFRLNEALKNPYSSEFPDLQQKRPDWADGVPGCSMLSCSS